METEQILAILVNVGGATAPAIHTLNQHKPHFICFFVSAETRPLINATILPALSYRYEHYDWIETPTAQSLLECYRALTTNLPQIMEKWKIPRESLGVEYTAGTKPMSVAAVLATIDFCSNYFYTGARDPAGRDRDGIGIVLDGKEFSWFQTNPWEELAIQSRKEIAWLFNLGRFEDARERVLRLAGLAPAEMRKVYQALAELIEGYALWDRFQYRQAQSKIFKGLEALRLYTAGREDALGSTLSFVQLNAQFLSDLNDKSSPSAEKQSRRLAELDMLSNAIRRAQSGQRYDDAVARLYSLLEAIARNRLLDRHQIITKKTRPEQVPESLRADFTRRLADPEHPQEWLRLGLLDSYRLLFALNDPLGLKFSQMEAELIEVLRARNLSPLAHGNEPVKPETYQRLLQVVYAFAEVQEEKLPRFPDFKF